LISHERMRVAFVVNELTLGGAEMMLWKLLSRIDRTRFDTLVIALSSRTDSLQKRFDDDEIPVRSLGMQPRLRAAAGLVRLAGVLRSFKPHLVQGWMYHGNLAASVGAALAHQRTPVLWNVRGTLPLQANWRSSLVIKVTGRLARFPSRIINNSITSAEQHERVLGYPMSARAIMPNGFDTAQFRARPEARPGLRRACGVGPHTLLIGLIGRFHPMKDHRTFLHAGALLRASHPEVHYVLAGEDVDQSNRELAGLVSELRLQGHVSMLGRRDDMSHVTAGLDIACSASAYGEGFPNVIGEAMSCEVPCVVTDVGDSARIVDDTGAVVSPGNPSALAAALARMVAMSPGMRSALGRRARQRIIDCYSLEAVVRGYETLYTQVYDKRGARAGRHGSVPARSEERR
jgi:glycosyltransferase involved in cell wall biosynthesis